MTKKEQTSAIVEHFKKCNSKDFFNYVEMVKTKNEKNLAVFGYFRTIDSKLSTIMVNREWRKKNEFQSFQISPDLEEEYGTVLDQNGVRWNNLILGGHISSIGQYLTFAYSGKSCLGGRQNGKSGGRKSNFAFVPQRKNCARSPLH